MDERDLDRRARELREDREKHERMTSAVHELGDHAPAAEASEEYFKFLGVTADHDEAATLLRTAWWFATTHGRTFRSVCEWFREDAPEPDVAIGKRQFHAVPETGPTAAFPDTRMSVAQMAEGLGYVGRVLRGESVPDTNPEISTAVLDNQRLAEEAAALRLEVSLSLAAIHSAGFRVEGAPRLHELVDEVLRARVEVLESVERLQSYREAAEVFQNAVYTRERAERLALREAGVPLGGLVEDGIKSIARRLNEAELKASGEWDDDLQKQNGEALRILQQVTRDGSLVECAHEAVNELERARDAAAGLPGGDVIDATYPEERPTALAGISADGLRGVARDVRHCLHPGTPLEVMAETLEYLAALVDQVERLKVGNGR